MARNFIGKVTRHSEKAGVTLRARVTSPSENVTAYKDFKCTVKASGLSDEQAVITDLNYIATNLMISGVTGIKQNLTTHMPKTGPNDTNVTYTVIGEEISNYFNSDGVVVKRPAYGEPAIVGSLYVYVTKNEAAAGREITISIDPYTIAEVKESITGTITWEQIRGANWAESSEEDTNGPSNVIHPLQLISEIKSELIADPIKITWEIKSDTLSELLKTPRINITEDGKNCEIYRPVYTDMLKAKESNYTYQNNMTMCQSKIESTAGRTYIRLGGLVLIASFNFVDSVNNTTIKDSVVFNLKTLTVPATNSEVALYVQSMISQFQITDLTYNQTFSTLTENDGEESARNVYYDDNYTNPLNASILDLYTKNDIIAATKSNSFTNELQGLKITSVNWSIIAPNSIDTSSPVAITNPQGYSYVGLTSPTMDYNDELTLTLNPVNPVYDKLILRVSISFAQYDDVPAAANAIYWFNFIDSETIMPPVVEPEPEDPSQGEPEDETQE